MAEQDRLSLEEALKLAEKVIFWKKVQKDVDESTPEFDEHVNDFIEEEVGVTKLDLTEYKGSICPCKYSIFILYKMIPIFGYAEEENKVDPRVKEIFNKAQNPDFEKFGEHIKKDINKKRVEGITYAKNLLKMYRER